MELTDYKPNIDDLLTLRKYNPEYIPSKENILFSVGSKHVGSMQSFVTFSGLAKAGKSTFLAALIASAFVPYEIFTMKLHLPIDRKKICYFDTESSDYDFFRQINKIKGFCEFNNLPEYFNAFQVREDGSTQIRKMIERYLELNADCSILIIDGLLDLLIDANDTRESKLLTNWLKKITKNFNILIITVLHQSKSNLSTTGHLGSFSDRFAQSTLEIVKDKDANTFVLSSRFMRSDADFEPVTLMNFNGIFQQVESTEVQKPVGKKASDLDDMESKRICTQIIVMPMQYSEIIDEIIERTAHGKVYAKNLFKIWINKSWIIKDQNNKYKLR